MADCIPCKNCGHYEGAHFDSSRGDRDELWPGYKKTLNNCPGYLPRNKRLAEKLKKKAKKEETEQKIINSGGNNDLKYKC